MPIGDNGGTGMKNIDPTYDRKEIKKNLIWNIAFILSECLNDNAPIGWGKYIWVAKSIEKGL